MIQKVRAILLALIITLGVGVPTSTIMQAQAQDNATSTTNTTTTETNTTIPFEPESGAEFPTQLPSFPEPEPPEAIAIENQTDIIQADNLTQSESESESQDNATQADTLLNDAQTKIDEARNLIFALQTQIQDIKANCTCPEAAPGNDTGTGEIVESANESAEEIIDIIEEEVTNDTEVVDNVGNSTEDIIDAIEDSIDSNENATTEDIENITEEVIEAIDNATENTDNSTTEVAISNGLIRLLSNLVAAQDYNENLAQGERDELKANLEDAIEELARDAANSLR